MYSIHLLLRLIYYIKLFGLSLYSYLVCSQTFCYHLCIGTTRTIYFVRLIIFKAIKYYVRVFKILFSWKVTCFSHVRNVCTQYISGNISN